MQNWQAIESLRWVALISLGAVLLAGMLTTLKAITTPSQSISQIWASNKRSHRILSTVLTIFGAGFGASIIGWLIPAYQLWPGMYPVVLLGYLAILTVAWFPITDNPGEHSLRHPHFIGGAAAACGAVIGYASILLAGADIPRLSYFLTILALIYSSLWPAFFLRSMRKYFMILEVVLVALFVAVIVALTFGW